MIENHMVILTGADIARERFESQWETAQDERTQEWADEIESCFADVVPSNVHRRVFPKADYKNNQINTVTLADVVEYEMDAEVAKKVAEVIAKVDHPAVRELRDLLCSLWKDRQADSLAEVGKV